jgi:hypothetical protein
VLAREGCIDAGGRRRNVHSSTSAPFDATSRIRNLYCPNSKMPKLRYTDDQLKALIDFLLSLK